MKNPINVARALWSYITLVRDPNKLNMVFELREAISDREMLDRMASNFARDPKGARALHERPRLGRIDLESLSKLPDGTLGRVYADHMIANNLDPSAIPSLQADNPGDYLTAHLYETHDIWHAVTGFATDVSGELGLQAFYVGQFPAPLALAIISGGLLNTMLFKLDEVDSRMSAIAEGYRMGRKAKSLFGTDWKQLFETPIDEVRKQFNIERTTVSSFDEKHPSHIVSSSLAA
ncbi:MAG: Coq4 family protein [Polyangiaceae bacterium]